MLSSEQQICIDAYPFAIICRMFPDVCDEHRKLSVKVENKPESERRRV